MANGDDTTGSNSLTISLPDPTGYQLSPGGNALLLPAPSQAPNELSVTAPRAPVTSSGTYEDAILNHEGYGVKGNVPTGYGGFQPRTWQSFAAANPDLFQGKSPDEVLAMRTDKEMARKGITWLAQQNANYLQKNGFEVNGTNLGIAHFLGPGGARAALSSPDTMSMRDVLGTFLKPNEVDNWIKENPMLGKWTVADLKNEYSSTKFPNPGFAGGPTSHTTVAATSTAPDPATVQQSQTKNPLAMAQPEEPMDMKKMMAMAALQAILPKGFAYHPIDFDPFKRAYEAGIQHPTERISGLPGLARPTEVQSAPARAAYDPGTFLDLMRQGVRRRT